LIRDVIEKEEQFKKGGIIAGQKNREPLGHEHKKG